MGWAGRDPSPDGPVWLVSDHERPLGRAWFALVSRRRQLGQAVGNRALRRTGSLFAHAQQGHEVVPPRGMDLAVHRAVVFTEQTPPFHVPDLDVPAADLPQVRSADRTGERATVLVKQVLRANGDW
jgi:hypothetical protein